MQKERNRGILFEFMTRHTRRFRNVHVIVATSAGLVLLVSLALGWLGWKLLSQEEALQKQQAHSRLEQRADVLLAVVLRRTAETEAWLGQIGPALPPRSTSPSPPTPGGILVSFSKSGVEVQPPDKLLYLPVTPTPQVSDGTQFASANALEFQSGDLKGAVRVLASLAESKDTRIRDEALLSIASVQRKSGQIPEALATYAKLVNENLISASGEPYALLSRLQRCKLLADSHEQTLARQEAAQLVASLEAGEWPISKDWYVYYNVNVRKLAGLSSQSPALDIKLAAAEAVESAWREWQVFQRSGANSLTKHLHSSEPVPTMTIVNANPERMVSLIYAGEALRHLALDLDPNAENRDIQAFLTDEHGQALFSATISPTAPEVTRSSAELPWQFHVTAATTDPSSLFPKERRNYLILVLAAIILLVFLACYAMARGVLREAAAGRLQSDFVSAVSHEFRSPLTTLRQLTELLADGRIHDENRRRQYFIVLQQETSRLHQLVEDLLDFGRMDAGRRQYRLERLDFSELVRDGIEEFQSQATTNGHRIEIASDHNKLLVDADREAMRRVVRNLLENAVKYSPEATTVWVETGAEERAAILRVRDEGIGIPPEEKSRIFEKFVRGDAAKKACIPGTGIGLAMVKEIVRVHHGDVDLSSEVGRGSTFMVRLPLSSAVHGSSQ
jgi:signal transduction histidine kinase